ncbi:MAG: hypothetical protein N3A01_00225 [Bacteroidales bacterium]|nr:hypothetical protein [Bacteroidales bacterium]
MLNSKSIKKSIVFANLTSAGLGNKMYVWTKAFLFARKYNLELYRSSWINFHPRAYIRNLKGIQKDLRFYGGIFKARSLTSIVKLNYYKKKFIKIYEPFNKEPESNEIFVFCIYPQHQYFLHQYVNEKELIKNFIFKNLKKRIIEKYNNLDEPLISIHLRRGDLLVANNNLVTPLDDVIKIIYFFKERYNRFLPIYIFTDSPAKQLKNLLSIPNVFYKTTYNPMIDLLHISKSRIIIPSIVSSFSTWACFFSSAIILRHPNDTVKVPFTPLLYKETFFNDNFQINDENVLRNIDSIIENFFKTNY